MNQQDNKGSQSLSPLCLPRCRALVAEKYRAPFACALKASEWREDRPVCGTHARARQITWADTGEASRSVPRNACCEATTRAGKRCGKKASQLTTRGRHYRCLWHL